MLSFVLMTLLASTTPMNNAERTAWDAVLRINRMWSSERDLAGFAELLHPDIVIIDPLHHDRIEGRDAVVASYKVYLEAVPEIHYFRERDPRIRIYDGRFAVVTYYWDMSYVPKGGSPVKVSGRDMYVLVLEGGRWLAVADQFSEFPKSS